MPWYAAHLIEYLKYADGVQDDYTVYENVVLIKAENTEEAFIEAKKIGLRGEVDTEVGPDYRKARWTFAGVRNLVECQDTEPESLNQPADFVPKHGTEVTYISLAVATKEDLDKLVSGESVKVELNEIPVSED